MPCFLFYLERLNAIVIARSAINPMPALQPPPPPPEDGAGVGVGSGVGAGLGVGSGAGSGSLLDFIVIVKSFDAFSALATAVTVNVYSPAVKGVPDIVPVLTVRSNPVGSEPSDIDHVTSSDSLFTVSVSR